VAEDASKRPRGRPRLDPGDASVDVHFRLPAKQYDRLCHEASTERLSLADLFRSVLTERLRRP